MLGLDPGEGLLDAGAALGQGAIGNGISRRIGQRFGDALLGVDAVALVAKLSRELLQIGDLAPALLELAAQTLGRMLGGLGFHAATRVAPETTSQRVLVRLAITEKTHMSQVLARKAESASVGASCTNALKRRLTQ